MTDKPIILASLVDARNVASSKEIKLDVRIPAEMAGKFLDVFGWPTQVSPISVAIVPLEGTKGIVSVVVDEAPVDVAQPTLEPVSEDAFKRKNEILDEAIDKLEKVKDRTTFTKLPRVKQAGIRCNEPAFWSYLTTRFSHGGFKATNSEEAAQIVRWYCMVDSRRDLDKPTGAARTLWDNLENDFWLKQHGME